MRRTIFVLFCLLDLLLSVAQSKSDLLELVNNGSDIDRYDALLELTGRYNLDQNDSAVWASTALVEAALDIGDNSQIGMAYRIAGIYMMDAGLHDRAITHYYTAINYFDKEDVDKRAEEISSCYHDIAWVLTYQGETDRALNMFYQALNTTLSSVKPDTSSLRMSYQALGSFYYLYSPNIDSAEFYLLKSISYGQKMGETQEELAEARLELINAYLFSDTPEKGEPLLRFMKSIPNDSLSQYSIEYIKYLEGLKYHNRGEYRTALDIFVPIYDWTISAQSHQSETGINLLRQMVQTAEAGGFFEEAFHYLEILRDTETATIYKDRQRTTKALEVEFETVRKEQLIATQQTRLTQQQRTLWIVTISSLIILALLVVVVQTYRRISQKNRKIETLMRELHHRVKNNLQVISSLLGLQSMKLDDVNAKRAVDEGKERIRAMSLIHQKLYQNDEVTRLDVHDYLSNLVGELAASYGFSDRAQLTIDVPSISLDADTTLPIGLIVNELVSNAFKYAYSDIEKPILELKLLQDQGNFILNIRDNGKGLPVGFSVTEANSFGLRLVNLLVRQLKGQLLIEQESGLSFQIKFQSV